MLMRMLYLNLEGVKDLKKAKDFGYEFCFFLLENNLKTYGEAMRFIDAPFWKIVINDEMNSLKLIKLGCDFN